MPETAQPSPPIRDTEDLWRHFASGEKPPASHRLGVEHEKILVLAGGVAPPYDGVIERVLEELRDQAGWEAVGEGGRIIALRRMGPTGLATVSLEPGGQLELSDAQRSSAREAEAAIRQHLGELAGPARALGLRMIGIGFRPFGALDDVPWMPKGRYRVMRAYLPARGALAHEMMKRTATVQVNIDYADQADCAAKMRTALGTSSLVTALWAASPIVDGRVTGEQSHRAACWLETDPDRAGLLPFVFAADAADSLYRAYAEWALDVPMFFVHRGGEYRPAHGLPFRRFVAEGWAGERATEADWELHLSTLFPETRLKRYIEMRGADSGPLAMVSALPALYRGLLYDAEACAAAWSLVADWSMDEREALRRDVPGRGLRAEVRGAAIAPLARELVNIARAGLLRLGGAADVPLLDPVERIARTGHTVADEIRDLFQRTGGDPDRLSDLLALPLELERSDQ